MGTTAAFSGTKTQYTRDKITVEVMEKSWFTHPKQRKGSFISRQSYDIGLLGCIGYNFGALFKKG